MVTKRVNRPIFRLAKPGQETRWTTRPGSQSEAIRTRKMELATPPPGLPTELPEKEPEQGENDPAYRSMIDAKMKAFSFPSPDDLARLSDAELEAIETNDDSEVEAVDLEMDRRGYSTQALTPEDIARQEYLRKRLAE
jgi:hypothetical protein